MTTAPCNGLRRAAAGASPPRSAPAYTVAPPRARTHARPRQPAPPAAAPTPRRSRRRAPASRAARRRPPAASTATTSAATRSCAPVRRALAPGHGPRGRAHRRAARSSGPARPPACPASSYQPTAGADTCSCLAGGSLGTTTVSGANGGTYSNNGTSASLVCTGAPTPAARAGRPGLTAPAPRSWPPSCQHAPRAATSRRQARRRASALSATPPTASPATPSSAPVRAPGMPRAAPCRPDVRAALAARPRPTRTACPNGQYQTPTTANQPSCQACQAGYDTSAGGNGVGGTGAISPANCVGTSARLTPGTRVRLTDGRTAAHARPSALSVRARLLPAHPRHPLRRSGRAPPSSRSLCVASDGSRTRCVRRVTHPQRPRPTTTLLARPTPRCCRAQAAPARRASPPRRTCRPAFVRPRPPAPRPRHSSLTPPFGRTRTRGRTHVAACVAGWFSNTASDCAGPPRSAAARAGRCAAHAARRARGAAARPRRSVLRQHVRQLWPVHRQHLLHQLQPGLRHGQHRDADRQHGLQHPYGPPRRAAPRAPTADDGAAQRVPRAPACSCAPQACTVNWYTAGNNVSCASCAAGTSTNYQRGAAQCTGTRARAKHRAAPRSHD